MREEIDIYLKGDYTKLSNSPVQDNEYLVTKLLSMMKELGNFETKLQASLIKCMPEALLQTMHELGYH